MSGEQRSTSDVDLTAPEFRDYSGPLVPPGFSFDSSKLLTAKSLRGLAAVVVAVVIIAVAGNSPRALTILLAVLLLSSAAGGLLELRDPRWRNWIGFLHVVVPAVIGALLLFVADFTAERLSLFLGIGLLAIAAFNGVRAVTSRTVKRGVEPLLDACFYAILGAALIVAPYTILGLAVLVLALYWLVAGLAAVVVNVRVDDREIEPANTWRMFLQWIQTRPNTADDRSQLYQKLFYEGEAAARRLSRFYVLMALATAIAAWGIIADSTAVVIGAMLVAPLMTPLMGTSLSIAMGWMRRTAMSASVAGTGVLLAITLSMLFGWIYGADISPDLNTQVASRIEPTLIDLAIAIAAGCAGAFALSRPDVSDSLPGVAVAIALVPPLAVIGLMLSHGHFDAALGATLLFATNLVAILLFGGLTFVLTGVVPVLQLMHNPSWRGRTLGAVFAVGVAIVALLGVNFRAFTSQTSGVDSVQSVAADWADDRDLTVTNTQYTDGQFVITVTGPTRPPATEELADLVAVELGEITKVEVTWLPSETHEGRP